MKQNIAKAGWVYDLESWQDGKLIHTQRAHNLIPIEGINNMLDVWLKQATQPTKFYIGLYEGNYTPVPGDTAASFPAAATELTAYSEATRVEVVLGAVAAGSVTNFDSPAEFTGTTAGKQAAGGFISTSPTKGSTTGVLCSAVRFPSPQPIGTGVKLLVKASFQIVSA